jgi:hypothetical protein
MTTEKGNLSYSAEAVARFLPCERNGLLRLGDNARYKKLPF